MRVTLEVQGENESFSKEMKSPPGINRFLWNRQFDPLPVTAEEETIILEAFIEHDTTGGFIGRRYQDYQAAGDSTLLKRQIITRVAERIGLDPAMGIVSASPGTYQVTLRVGELIMRKDLVIREDPLLKINE